MFNWAFARHFGGKLVLRIEDTDVARNTESGLESVLSSLQPAGLDDDEGPVVGGPFAPYLQSERTDRYAAVAHALRERQGRRLLLLAGRLDERREQAHKEGRTAGYDGHCRP